MKISILLLITIYLYGCETPDLVSASLRVEVVAPLIAGEIAEVSLRKVYSIGERIDTLNTTFNNAELVLEENNQFFDSLYHDKNGIYYSKRRIRPDQNYILRGKIDGLPDFYSKSVLIPGELPVVNLSVKKDTILEAFGQGLPFANFEYDTQGSQLNDAQSLIMSFLVTFKNSQKPIASIFTNSTTDYKIVNCRTYSTSYEPSFPGHIIFDINCIKEQARTIPFFVETNRWDYGNSANFQDRKLITADKVELSYAVVSKELFLYNKKIESQPSGVDRLLADPVTSYSNMINASGIVYGVIAGKKQIR